MRQDPRLISNARTLRREITPAERILWKELRGWRFQGLRFRRQHVVKPYIADFYCAICDLVVELDGESHLGKENEDLVRTKHLESGGLKVLRFWNSDVFENLEGVLEVIYRDCLARRRIPSVAKVSPRIDMEIVPDRSPLTPGPSPQRGEGC